MRLSEYQTRAMETARYPKTPIAWLYPILNLSGEVGEVSGKLAKIVRDKDGIISEEDRFKIRDEIGDVLWQLAALSYELGFSLDYVAMANLEKLASRRERGVIQGSGDNR